ncbi:MAG: hypothetical protein Q4F93_06250 [bacterium]|nr:hypothetical protein [bacterium]
MADFQCAISLFDIGEQQMSNKSVTKKPKKSGKIPKIEANLSLFLEMIRSSLWVKFVAFVALKPSSNK